MGAGFPQAGFRFCTCMKGWHMSREPSIAGKLHQGMAQTSHGQGVIGCRSCARASGRHMSRESSIADRRREKASSGIPSPLPL